MERNCLDKKNTDQPCLTSCCGRTQGAKEVASSYTQSPFTRVHLQRYPWPWLSICSLLIPLSCTHSCLQEGSPARRENLPISLQVSPRRGLITRKNKPQWLAGWSQLCTAHKGKQHRGYFGFPEHDNSFLLRWARQLLVLLIPQAVAQSPDTHFHCSCCLRGFLASKVHLFKPFNDFISKYSFIRKS